MIAKLSALGVGRGARGQTLQYELGVLDSAPSLQRLADEILRRSAATRVNRRARQPLSQLIVKQRHRLARSQRQLLGRRRHPRFKAPGQHPKQIAGSPGTARLQGIR